ncbi:fucolectin-4-like [Rhopilema esculentum]|uniref:fucolectin-4-like n=1 Tax=Rhopilema esculentum TaxID=499914 RepID=UPI0031DE4A71
MSRQAKFDHLLGVLLLGSENHQNYAPVANSSQFSFYEGNIAYKKPSSQSSTSTIESIPLVARFANDGNRTGVWQGCSITQADVTPWWQVDLTRQAAVASVQIRSGATWGQLKINPFDVSVGDDSSNGGRNNALCVKDGKLASGELRKFDCPQVLTGRYVSVYLNREEHLQVCEVEVYEDVF